MFHEKLVNATILIMWVMIDYNFKRPISTTVSSQHGMSSNSEQANEASSAINQVF
jgi:hypothetical protein